MSAEDEKRAAGEAAAAHVAALRSQAAGAFTVGLGTGSTAVCFVRALARRQLDVDCVPTSDATAALAAELGLRLVDLEAAGRLEVTVDGADEIGPGLCLIKGGGGALLREKLVWEASKTCVVIADAGKRVERLGAFPLPVEITPFGWTGTAARVRDVFARFGVLEAPVLRTRDGAPFVTDGGHYILDTACGVIDDPVGLAHALKGVTGVVDHGLFIGLASTALIAVGDRVETVTGGRT